MEAERVTIEVLEYTEDSILDTCPLCVLGVNDVAVALSDGFIEIANRDIMSNINLN